MAKFAIACPKCGKYAEAKTGFFARKKIECSCGNIIDVRTDIWRCPTMKRKIVTMKKITLAILALIIILCFGISFAEGDNALEQTTDASVQNDKAEKEEDILFRNIPWGSSVNETINVLKDQFGSVQVAGRKLHPWFNIRPDNNKIHNTQVIICEVSIPELQVAGYGVYEFKTLDAQPNKFGNREWIPRKEGNNVILYFYPCDQ